MTELAQQVPTPIEAPVAWTTALAAIVGAIAVLWKPVRAIGRGIKAVQQFIADWNGTPDVHDASGAIKEHGSPGVPAMLEKVRSQVENSHHTNLRDDVDDLRGTVNQIGKKLDTHIVIADQYNEKQEETAEKVERLHARWAASADRPDDH